MKLGGVEPTKEAWRDRSTIPVLEHLLQDGRYALRQLRQHVGFTCTAILTLALGTGASVAIFAFVDAALLKPLPYQDPSRLVGVFETVALFPQSNLSYPDYLDWKKLNQVMTLAGRVRPDGVQAEHRDGRPTRDRSPGERRVLSHPRRQHPCWGVTSTTARTCSQHPAPSCSATVRGRRGTGAARTSWARRSS